MQPLGPHARAACMRLPCRCMDTELHAAPCALCMVPMHADWRTFFTTALKRALSVASSEGATLPPWNTLQQSL